jgi:hypothetical protein
MGLIVLALIAGGWFLLSRILGGGCDDPYCAISLDVDPPEGFAFASDVYEFRGEAPELPDGGSVEVEIPLTDPGNGTGLSFYRYLPDASAWELVAPAALDEEGTRAIGTFPELPATIVVMRRISPAGHVAVFIDAGQQLHTQAAERATIIHTRDFTPGGDGSVNGQLTPVSLGPGQEHYPVISAGQGIDNTIANVDAILATSTSRTSHVSRIVALATTLELDGVGISFMDLREDQRTSFGLFIEELATELRRAGKGLAVVVPAPTRTTERIEPGAYDWQVIGAAADLVAIAPIRDQSTYRRDLPQILNYIRERVDPRKVLLTVTPYAAERSDGVRAMTLVDAMRIATRIQVGDSEPGTNENVQLIGVNIDRDEGLSGIVWDESTATVAFTYRDDGGRTVWIENQYSVSFKLEFVSAYGLGGFAVEDGSNNEFLGNIWPALVSFINTGQPELRRPDPQDLEPRWEVSGGTIEGGQRGVARWTTPSEPGTYTVRLTLSDGVFLFQSEVQITVEARDATGTGGG